MRIAFPSQDNRGMDSPVYGHFGSAPYFIIVDSDTGTYESTDNSDSQHQHGQCRPMEALSGHTVDMVVVGGIGAGALKKLSAAGIKIYRAVEGSVSENFNLMQSGLLPLFTLDQTCAGHGPGETCAHSF